MKKAIGKVFAILQTKPVGSSRARKFKGQSLVEIAIAFPFLIMLLAGLVEFGFMLNYYLSLLDATREAARTYSNFDPFEDGYYLTPRDCTCTNAATCPNDTIAGNPDSTDADCDSTPFYQGAAGMVLDNLQPRDLNGDGVISPQEQAKDSSRRVILDSNTDDVIVSVFSVGNSTILRYPEDGGEYHWFNNQPSALSIDDIGNQLISAAPDTGILLVEVYFNYHQILALPWLAPFLPNPITLHAYTIMPCSAAEPH